MLEKIQQKQNTQEQPEKEKIPFATSESKSELKRIIQEMHSVHPDVIFFTMASSFNIAVALKETWRAAYPDEEIPLFYSINPHADDDKKVMDNLREKIEKIGKNFDLKSKTIVVFDEFRGGPGELYRKPISYDWQEIIRTGSGNRIRIGAKMLKKAISGVHFGKADNLYMLGAEGPKMASLGYGDDEIKVYKRTYNGNGRKNPDNVEIERNVHGSVGSEIINKLKDIGREAGENLRKELIKDVSNQSGKE